MFYVLKYLLTIIDNTCNLIHTILVYIEMIIKLKPNLPSFIIKILDVCQLIQLKDKTVFLYNYLLMEEL